MPQSPYRATAGSPSRASDHHYDPEALDALSHRHAELQRELETIRVQFGHRAIATVLEQLAAFHVQTRGLVDTIEAVLLRPLERDWGRDRRVCDRIICSRARWRSLEAGFASIAEALAAVDIDDAPALAALDFRLAEASYRLGEALREDRSSLFLLYLSPHQAPPRPH